MPTRCPNTCCEAFPGIETCGWLMLSTTATTCSRAAGIHVMLGSGWNTGASVAPASARIDDELLGLVVDLRRGALGLHEGAVDHQVIAADVPLPDDDPERHVPGVGEPVARDPLR